MLLGFQPDLDHGVLDAFEFAKNHGFTHIEFLMDHPSFHYEVVSYEEIFELSLSYDVEILIHASSAYTNFLSISSEMRNASYRELENTIEFAEKCDAKLITVHLGWNPGFISARGFIFKEEWYDRHNEKVLTEEFLPFVKNHDLIAIENTINISGGIKRAMEKILRESDVKLTFDIGHANVKRGHDIFIQNFDRIANLHLHDNKGDYDKHLALGKGEIDFSIIPRDFDGYITLESRDEDAILESKDYIKKAGLWI